MKSKNLATVAVIAAAAYLATRKGGPLAGLGQDDQGHYAGPPPMYYGGYGYGYPYNNSYGYPYNGYYGGGYGYYGYPYYGGYSGTPYQSGPAFSGGPPVVSSQAGAQMCVGSGGDYNSFTGQCSPPSGPGATPYFGTW